MTAQRVDITIEQGADFLQVFQIADPKITSAELIGASAIMQFRTEYGYPNAILTLSTDGSLSINASTREITATVGWEVTEALLAVNAVHDIKVRTASGRHVRTHQGIASISPQVTVSEPPSPDPSPAPIEYTTADDEVYTTADGTSYTTGQ